jgi:tRNA(Ile2) C34 agmatinyltransferase TiaS
MSADQEATETKCPSCGGEIESYPDQDGACDYYCLRCSWHEHVPGSEELAAVRTLHGSPPQKDEPKSR